jgi:hypothetical protein
MTGNISRHLSLLSTVTLKGSFVLVFTLVLAYTFHHSPESPYSVLCSVTLLNQSLLLLG